MGAAVRRSLTRHYLDLAREAQARCGGPLDQATLARHLLLSKRMVRTYLRRWEADGSAERHPGHRWSFQ